MTHVESTAYDLWYDANTVGADFVVETWISHGPRAKDAGFDPQPGDWVRLGDDGDAELPSDAIDTGYQREGRRLWLSSDRAIAFIVSDDVVEAWPSSPEQYVCA